jgi:hypothetical protein
VPVFDETSLWINNYVVNFILCGIRTMRRVDHFDVERRRARDVERGIHAEAGQAGRVRRRFSAC